MRLIVRVDNIGWDSGGNDAARRSIEHGIATAVHVRLDAPETASALQRLKDYPWISVGWQCDFLGKPVRAAEKVPTLVDRNGNFRPDLITAQDVSRIEALLELRAELFRCASFLGYIPTYRNRVFSKTSPFGRAIGEIDQEFGIVTRFVREPDAADTDALDEQWENRRIVRMPRPEPSDDAAGAFLRCAEPLLARDENTWISQWTPETAEALCDSRLTDWIAENGVELVNYHDALFGTREYQNHLRGTGSDLSVL